MGEKLTKEEKQKEEWRKSLTVGIAPAHALRRFFRMLPSSPRCGMCMAPFKGIGSIILKPLPFTTPSRKNPTWCKMCFEASPIGGAEVPTGVLFADIRGFTAHAESLAPEEVARQLNRFYAVATDVFARHDAVIDKLVGDEVMALWVPGFAARTTSRAWWMARSNCYRQSALGVKKDPGSTSASASIPESPSSATSGLAT